ncbi:MAG: hypothetical protein KAY32_13800, partial [Candidatus Eisenbacteria sp.]|nr:hypothetical protein [Candidatus Eisenbacteria bacterium]
SAGGAECAGGPTPRGQPRGEGVGRATSASRGGAECPAGPTRGDGGALAGRVLRRLRAGAELGVEELAERLPGVAPGALPAALATLEIEGRVARRGGRWRAIWSG